MNDGGLDGAGGAGGGGGGAGGEDIGVAQEADTCCCSISVSGTMNCTVVAGGCGPYTTSTEGACSSGPDTNTSTGGCSDSGVRSGTGGSVAMIVLFLALAAFRAMRRRFAQG